MRFQDRTSAGVALIGPIRRLLRRGENTVVLALARGGVVVAAPVADVLRFPMDVMVVRKLGVPWQPELALGAMARGKVLLDDQIIQQTAVSVPDIEHVIARENVELDRLERIYRHRVLAIPLTNRTLILIDDGSATGSALDMAVAAVRESTPARILVAIPVAPLEAVAHLRLLVDELICLTAVSDFHGAGEWYRNFSPVTDPEVVRVLEQSRQRYRTHQIA
jgi:putative phosphoribosyl transferase